MLQDDIARNFDAQIDDEKDGQDDIVAVTDEVEIRGHAFNLGVSGRPVVLARPSYFSDGGALCTHPILARSIAQHMSLGEVAC